MKKRVYVGMSGGVDSSVSTALLVRAGYDVTGVFIKVWQPDWFECTWREDRLDAMRVAAKLDIPFITLDLEEVYKREVVDYMIAEYRAGRTPNPDVMCNRYVKFGGFFDWAMKQDPNAYVATGHYARAHVRADGDSSSLVELVAGDDANKDQSYFLWTLGQRELSRTLFPVGNIEKPEVRQLAQKFGLPNADKKDSQGLCFIGKVDVKKFLGHYIKQKSGDVLDAKTGRVIGKHEGSWFYTIGERHGFDIHEKTPNDAPYYVVAKDIDKNTVTVANRDDSAVDDFSKKKIELKNVNWNTGKAPDPKKIYKARARYRQKLVDMRVSGTNVEFVEKQESISSGQSLVVYDGNVCLGGGVIE